MDSTLPHEIAPGCQAQAPPLLAAMTTSAVDSPRLSPAAALFIPTNRTSTSPVAPEVNKPQLPDEGVPSGP
ncbi:hypothetical protein HaLaN_09934 [Haematococcus lacustris]|uniref:Uncharacterized protein n=1 Tax=Haematococcus lacustris TaxID=44745 RepID=A0A699YXK5_HAELA|nr:hypothetical protein HaLaN_09934 [Haematococcus lacustris]